MAPSEYCACDGLPDEWISLIPNVKESNRLMHEKIIQYRREEGGDPTYTKTKLLFGEGLKRLLKNTKLTKDQNGRRANIRLKSTTARKSQSPRDKSKKRG